MNRLDTSYTVDSGENDDAENSTTEYPIATIL